MYSKFTLKLPISFIVTTQLSVRVSDSCIISGLDYTTGLSSVVRMNRYFCRDCIHSIVLHTVICLASTLLTPPQYGVIGRQFLVTVPYRPYNNTAFATLVHKFLIPLIHDPSGHIAHFCRATWRSTDKPSAMTRLVTFTQVQRVHAEGPG